MHIRTDLQVSMTQNLSQESLQGHLIRMSAPLAFDGTSCAYHGDCGQHRFRVQFWRRSLRNAYHIQERQPLLPTPDLGEQWRKILTQDFFKAL